MRKARTAPKKIGARSSRWSRRPALRSPGSSTLPTTFDPNFRTEVEARFTPTGPNSCRVEFEHRGLEAYGAAAEQMQEMLASPNGWLLEVSGLAKACTAG
jgi:hypothetical protein